MRREDFEDKAEALGATAALSGKTRGSNPFQEGSNFHFMWDIGWLEREHSTAPNRYKS